MNKRITANTNVSASGRLVAGLLCVAGIAVILFGVSTMLTGQANAMGQFGLSVLLGGGLIAIGAFTIRSQLQQRKKIKWLDQHGTWIKANAIGVKTITTDSVGQCESYRFELEPSAAANKRFGLDGIQFESEQIWARSVPSNYQDLEFDVVIDADSPANNYFVNLDLHTLLSETHETQ